jgi:hypothetical protein
MLNRSFFLGALMALSVSFLAAFSNDKTESSTVYEYVTIIQDQVRLTVNEQGKPAVVEVLKKDRQSLSSGYEMVNKYETAGFELYQSNSFTDTYGHVSSYLLRRKKQ